MKVRSSFFGIAQTVFILLNSNFILLAATILNLLSFRNSKISVSTLLLSWLSFLYFLTHIIYSINFGYTLEIKIGIITIILAVINIFGCVKISNKKSNALILGLSFYALLTISTTFPVIFRFSDLTTFPLKLISVYVGILSVLLAFLTTSPSYRVVAGIICVATGSGTAMIGLLLLTFSYLKGKNFLFIVFCIVLICVAFSFNQFARGRLDGNWMSVDRLVIFAGTVNFLVNEFAIFNWLFGTGLSSKLPPGFYSQILIFNADVAGYLESEGLNYGSGRNFHNEHLRFIFHVGIVGWLLFWLCVRRFVSGTKCFIPIFIMSFFGSVVLVSSIILMLLFFVHQKN